MLYRLSESRFLFKLNVRADRKELRFHLFSPLPALATLLCSIYTIYICYHTYIILWGSEFVRAPEHFRKSNEIQHLKASLVEVQTKV